jgi:molecular chaperone DnaK (HSP70)
MIKQPSERIIELMSDVLKKMKESNLKMIVLVGGFSGCKIIQDNIKTFFPNHRVVVPEDAELAVTEIYERVFYFEMVLQFCVYQ